jgi:condensin complex subunit 3
MRRVALDALHKLFEVQETLEDEGDAETEMVAISTIGAHLVDWTDPRKCYIPGNQLTLGDEGSKKAVNGDVHLEFARDLLERLGSTITRKFLPVLTQFTTNNHQEKRRSSSRPSSKNCTSHPPPLLHCSAKFTPKSQMLSTRN